MKRRTATSLPGQPLQIEAVAGTIAGTQKPTGEIPWFEGGKTDPWDHVESAMGLTVGGFHPQARSAYRWMADNQNQDGSWFSAYKDGIPIDRTKETNLSAYIAVGVYHHWLVHGDTGFVKSMWDTVSAAIDFALSLQAGGGEIYWAISPEGDVDPMALLTGASSVHMSLKCALALSGILGIDTPRWHRGLESLGHAIRYSPQRFNMTKSRFSMDWFYPVLSGAITGREAERRIDRYWKKFVVPGEGVRCVSDEPWVTLAETAELVLTLSAIGHGTQARTVFEWMMDKRFSDGSFICGYTVPEMVVWPEEKYTWTNAVVLMAADALFNLTPASSLFSHPR